MFINSFIYKCLKLIKDIPVQWLFINKFQKQLKKKEVYEEIKKLQVLNGNFKGMKYPSMESTGSAFYPKILGSYEMEIEEIIKEAIYKYDVLIDVGCAEGYYAVGFALKNNNIKVYAFDTDVKAQKMCKKLSELNNVSDRVFVNNFFDEKSYEKIMTDSFNKRILILIDAEGFESKILNQSFKKIISNADLLIEIHDFIDPKITESCDNFLGQDYDKITVFSLDDFQKAIEYKFSQTANLPLDLKYLLFREGRPEQMKWFYAKKIN